MNTQWNQFLTENDVNLNTIKTQNQSAGTSFAGDTDMLCDLSAYGLIVIAGSDAMTFMQGQFTNDVSLVNARTGQLNAVCNNKGRVIADFILFQYQQNYFLSLHHSMVETVIEHLQKYIVHAQVAIQDVSDQLVHLGICGKQACNKLAELLQIDAATFFNKTADNKQPCAVYASDDYIVINNTDIQARCHVFAQTENAQTCWQQISEFATPVQANAWEGLNIQAGLPVITKVTSEAFVPQMLNLELLGGVSFKKGCYTGQEIVARMHYLGKLKKRMYKIFIDAAETSPPRPGDKIFAQQASAGQNTGMLVNVQPAVNHGFEALAVIQIADSQSALKLHDANGPAIKLETLPYSF